MNDWPAYVNTCFAAAKMQEAGIPKGDNRAAGSHDTDGYQQVNRENMYTRSHDRSQDGCQKNASSPYEDAIRHLNTTTKEVRKHMGCSTTDLSRFNRNPTDVFMHSFSSWFKLRRALVWYVKFIR